LTAHFIIGIQFFNGCPERWPLSSLAQSPPGFFWIPFYPWTHLSILAVPLNQEYFPNWRGWGTKVICKPYLSVQTHIIPSFSRTDLFQSRIVSPHVSPRRVLLDKSASSHLDLVNTSSQLDQDNPTKFPFLCQPDCSVYDAKSPYNNRLNSSLVECLIEFKMGSDSDPFVQDVPGKSSTVDTVQNLFMNSSSSSHKTAGQTAYATWILSTQYRTHLFLILIFKKHARIIHWDRSRAVVTAPISHSEIHILDFLMLFKDTSPQARSRDITVEHANKEDEAKARELEELTNTRSLLCLFIPDCSSPLLSHYTLLLYRTSGGGWCSTIYV